jgi:hypothetical protein
MPTEQKNIYSWSDSGAVLVEKSWLVIILHKLRDMGLAAPWLDVGPALPRLVALPGKVASPATIVALVTVVVVALLRCGELCNSEPGGAARWYQCSGPTRFQWRLERFPHIWTKSGSRARTVEFLLLVFLMPSMPKVCLFQSYGVEDINHNVRDNASSEKT